MSIHFDIKSSANIQRPVKNPPHSHSPYNWTTHKYPPPLYHDSIPPRFQSSARTSKPQSLSIRIICCHQHPFLFYLSKIGYDYSIGNDKWPHDLAHTAFRHNPHRASYFYMHFYKVNASNAYTILSIEFSRIRHLGI